MLDSVKNPLSSSCAGNSSPAGVFGAFSGVDFSSNKAYLSSVYSDKTIRYYNDSDEIKRKNTKRALVLGSVGLVLLSAVAFALNARALNRAQIAKSAKELGASVKNQAAPMAKNAVSNLGMISLNLGNLKDDIWDRFSMFLYEKTPLKFVKFFGDKLTKLYQKNIFNSSNKSFLNAQKEILEAPGGEAFKDKIADFGEMFNSLNSKFNQRARENRISSLNNLFGGKEKTLKNLYSSFSHPMVLDSVDDIVKSSANILEIPAGADEKLVEKIQNYNKLQEHVLIPKLVEVAWGSAPTDFILSALPVAGFGAALASADNNEERKSLMFNLGIPLLPTVFMPLLGTIYPVLSGVRAMVAGFAVGQVFSQGVKAADTFIKKGKNSKEDENKTP